MKKIRLELEFYIDDCITPEDLVIGENDCYDGFQITRDVEDQDLYDNAYILSYRYKPIIVSCKEV